MWLELSIVHGKPRHSQSQGSVERANQDVQKILFAWVEDNKTNRWSEGLKFCQVQKNCAYHTGIRQTPFEVMFGRKKSSRRNTDSTRFYKKDSPH
ncbi:KRAB-A domain-containing protein 2-like isoform X2 [Solenopsis invicta]|uniref:KRAB-A domain-containing protein 2-like isoform X2 n=1 Tax=Solenopsis invicta TaxID=13686 RepID=UPI00193DCB0D|nr:KRAB-A domain-containing protein 2-like isoform X2 [Solenopsis invicta]